MLESGVFALILLGVAVKAGVVPTYHQAPLTTIAKISAPLPYAAPRLTYAPVSYATHAPVVAAPAVSYASHAPVVAAPAISYASHAPVAYAAAPIAKAVVPTAVDTDYDPNPSYNYAYDIQDALTGDSKNQQESRQGDVVQGSYSLTEPDGTRRTVEYTADPVNGFNAVVHREPAVVQKAVVASPVAPVTYAHSPVYAAPVAKTVAYPSAYSTYH